MRLSLVFVAVTVLTLGAHVSPGATEAVAANCSPSPLGTVPTGNVGRGVKAGPIWFITGRAIRLAPHYPDRVYLTKVLIQAPKPLANNLTLTGFKCVSATPLRFWYPRRGEPPYPTDAYLSSSEELREAGVAAAVLYRFRHAQPTTRYGPLTDYRGFILFSAPGVWKIIVRSGTRVVGTAVLRASA